MYQSIYTFRFKKKAGAHAEIALLLDLHLLMPPNRIGGVMVSVVASSAVDRVFDPRSGQTNDYKILICCFSAKQAALRRKSKD